METPTIQRDPIPPLERIIPGFTEWRPGQAEAVGEVLDWMREREGDTTWRRVYHGTQPVEDLVPELSGLLKTRYMQIEAPTGSGKSVIAAAAARLSGRAAIILTETKQLQDQYEDSIPGIVSLKGMSTYPCPEYEQEEPGMTASDADGLHFDCAARKEGLCPYFNQLRKVERALETRGSVVMNYAKWQHLAGNEEFNEQVRKNAPLLVMDESDRLLDVATDAGTWDRSFAWIESRTKLTDYPRSTDERRWREWLPELRRALADRETGLSNTAQGVKGPRERSAEWLKEYKHLNRETAELWQARSKLDWLSDDFVARQDRVPQGQIKGVDLIPVAPRRVFRWRTDGQASGHVLLMSATPMPALMLGGLLGFEPAAVRVASTFDPERSPIRLSSNTQNTSYTARRADPGLIRRWADATLEEAERVREANPDSNTLIYARSGTNRDALIAAAEARALEIITYRALPGDRERAITRFMESRGAVLIGTGVERGISLDGDRCRLVVVGKAPILPPPSEDRLSERRQEIYPHYREVMEASDFAQVTGRAMRTDDDWCEIVITDGMWNYWIKKHREFLPDETRQRLGAHRGKVNRLAQEAGARSNGG